MRRTARRAPEEGEATELNLVPYLDILMNLILFLLLSIAGLAVMAALPINTTRGTATGLATSVSLRIDAQGFGLGDRRIERKGDGTLDFQALRTALVTERAGASSLVLSADPGIDYETVIAAIDAARERDDRAPLFTDIRLQ